MTSISPSDRHLPFPLRTLAVGLRPVPVVAWLEHDGDEVEAAELAAKAAVLAAAWDDVVAVEAGSEAAQDELLAAIVSASGAADPGGDEPAVVRASRLVAEDLVLLDATDHRVVAGVVCAPNRWRIPDKLGLSLLDVHGPVPGYAVALGDPVERVIRALRPGKVVERRNWSVLDDPTPCQPHEPSSRPVTLDIPGGLWLRVERQSLRRLPSTGAVVFTIRTRQWPLASLVEHRDQLAGLAESVGASPDDLLGYKGLAAAREALLAWTRSFD